MPRAAGTAEATDLPTLADVVRERVGPSCERFKDEHLLELIRRCGSLDLAVDALNMIPRPSWLERWELGDP